MKNHHRLFGVLLALIFSGCASTASNNNLNSLLWMQTSAEYRANSLQVYRNALQQVDEALRDNRSTAALEQTGDFSGLPPAVIMDIDETVLDNSRYMGKMVLEGKEWDPVTWDEWTALKEAGAVPGAVEFINEMHQKHVEVIFISNRACMKRAGSSDVCTQEADTSANLLKAGVVEVTPANILLAGETEGWGSEKKSRREYISKKYRIIMLFGDDLGDFLPGVKANITPEERRQIVEEHSNKWGRRWFMLSNPTYGSWLNILQEPKKQYIRKY